MALVVRGPALAVATVARRLTPLGAEGPGAAPTHGEHVRTWPAADDLEVELSWYGSGRLQDRPGSEAAVQALSGLMAVHGRDAGSPRRLGLEVASVATGLLATHAVLAACLGRRRGIVMTGVEGSVLQGALQLAAHRIAADSTGRDPWPVPAGPEPGPPFASAEGTLVEIETMDPVAWRAFWERLGAGDTDLDRAWRLFRPRYFRGTCTLPGGLHDATATHRLDELAAAAAACGVSLRPVRGYGDVLAELDGWRGRPAVEPLPVAGNSRGACTARPAGAPSPPLAGLRVVEATSRLQGPLAGLLLAQLGAAVLRVEPPGGDLVRGVEPLAGGTGTFFLSYNRGKEALEVDLARPAGREELRALVADADVFLHNWRPGKAGDWGLDAGALAEVNPGLVYAEASGWGPRAELGHLLGTDFLVQAHAGVAAGLTPSDEPAAPSRALLTDCAGALVTCEAILAGLLAREASGRGQQVTGSLLAGAMALQAHVLDALSAGHEAGRHDGRPVWGPLDRPVPTADGFLALSIEDAAGLERACAACGVPAGDDTERRLAAYLGGRPAAALEAELSAAGLACAVARTDPGTAPADPRLAGLFDPLGDGAAVPAAPWRLVP